MPRRKEPTSLRSLAKAAALQAPEERRALEKPATVAANPVMSELWELYAGSGMSYKPEDAPQMERLVTYVSMWLECREHCYDGEGRVIAMVGRGEPDPLTGEYADSKPNPYIDMMAKLEKTIGPLEDKLGVGLMPRIRAGLSAATGRAMVSISDQIYAAMRKAGI